MSSSGAIWKAAVRSALLLALCLGQAPAHAAEPESGATASAKKLIEFGWDEPDPIFLRDHLAEMEQTPFDGCVFHISFSKRGGGEVNFTWEGWGTNRFSKSDLEPAVQILRSIHPARLKHNFLRFNTTPGTLDWFDDYSGVIANSRLAAWAAKEGGSDGLLFDIEQYDGKLFRFDAQRDHKTKPWDEYAAQARRRGREVMAAFQEGYPGLKVFLTFGYSLPWIQMEHRKKSLAQCSYGLLAPFLNGLLDAAQGGTRIVDGCELSYGYKERHQFTDTYDMVRTGVLPLVSAPEKYARTVSVAFGLWLDHDWRKRGWDPKDGSRNDVTPDSFKTRVEGALSVADDYVWIYTEKPRWWSAERHPIDLPPEYMDALRHARQP